MMNALLSTTQNWSMAETETPVLPLLPSGLSHATLPLAVCLRIETAHWIENVVGWLLLERNRKRPHPCPSDSPCGTKWMEHFGQGSPRLIHSNFCSVMVALSICQGKHPSLPKCCQLHLQTIIDNYVMYRDRQKGVAVSKLQPGGATKRINAT